MDLQLTDKTALVTGSTAGIGYAIVATLAGEGAHVFVNGRTAERVDAAIDAIRAQHPQARLSRAPADLGTRAGVEALCKDLPEVEILVNSLGVFGPQAFEEIDDGRSMEEVEREFIAENRPSSLIRRLADTQEVANLAAYVCSPLSSATNGAPLRVDGGVVRSMA